MLSMSKGPKPWSARPAFVSFEEAPSPSAELAPKSPSKPKKDRLRFDLEIAVPVLIRAQGREQVGLARNISEGGMLLELPETLPIGSSVEVTIMGAKGSEDALESVLLYGEVRHNLNWTYNRKEGKRTLRAVGIRFVGQKASSEPSWPQQTWTWPESETLH